MAYYHHLKGCSDISVSDISITFLSFVLRIDRRGLGFFLASGSKSGFESSFLSTCYGIGMGDSRWLGFPIVLVSLVDDHWSGSE